MKSGPESTGVQRAPEKDEFVSRKLIRPTMSEGSGASLPDRPHRPAKIPHLDRRPAVEQTFAENFYFQKQVQAKTLMTLVLKNGDTVHGTIDWYDKNCIKIYRSGKPNLLIYKPGIRFMYKTADENRR